MININEKKLYHQTMKKNKDLFSLPVHQIESHNNTKFYNLEYTPNNSYANDIHENGGFIDFKFNSDFDYVYYDFRLLLKITESNVAACPLIAGPLIIHKIETMQNGAVVWTYPGIVQYIQNVIDLDKNSYEKQLMTDCGVLSTDFKKGLTVAQNSSVFLNINLHTIISNLYFYRAKVKGDLILRVHIRKGICETDAHNNNIVISDIKLFVNALKISNELKNHYLNLGLYDKKFNQWIDRSYTVSNGITSGQEFEVKLLGYAYHTSLMIIYITKINDTMPNILKTYGVSYLKLTDSNNQSQVNSILYNTSVMRNNIFKKLFPGSDFFAEKFYMINFSTNPHDDILYNDYNGSVLFNDWKLFITPSETEAASVTVNVLFLSPSHLNCSNGDLKVLNTV